MKKKEADYQGRVVVAGNIGYPMACYVLASRSTPERRLVVSDDKVRGVNINITGDLRERIRQNPHFPSGISTDSYRCMIGFHAKDGSQHIVASNGNLGKTIKRMMEAGHGRQFALDTGLLTYFPKEPNDPKLCAIVGTNNARTTSIFGNYHTDDGKFPPQSMVYYLEEGEVLYKTLKDCRGIVSLSKNETKDFKQLAEENLDELARQLFFSILGKKPVHGIGVAVGVIKEGEFTFGVFNDE